MSYMQQLRPKQKAEVRRIREQKGVEMANRKARNLGA